LTVVFYVDTRSVLIWIAPLLNMINKVLPIVKTKKPDMIKKPDNWAGERIASLEGTLPSPSPA